MKIGIDIDDTIINTSELVLDYLNNDGISLDLIDFKNYMRDAIKGDYSNKGVVLLLHKYGRDIAENASVKDGAVEVINYLKEKGHKIYIITSRSEKRIPNINKITEDFLNINNISYDQLFMGIDDKAQLCLTENIDYLIDDSVDKIEQLQQPTTGILFNSIINNDIETDVKRVNNWQEIKDYFDSEELI